ncbi:hypothetical protein EV361DRAFT_62299 [Lentinula raphanica]|nr:hypothetical protein EV361DRAFT_62299 [Lentinula raphanica]
MLCIWASRREISLLELSLCCQLQARLSALPNEPRNKMYYASELSLCQHSGRLAGDWVGHGNKQLPQEASKKFEGQERRRLEP